MAIGRSGRDEVPGSSCGGEISVSAGKNVSRERGPRVGSLCRAVYEQINLMEDFYEDWLLLYGVVLYLREVV